MSLLEPVRPSYLIDSNIAHELAADPEGAGRVGEAVETRLVEVLITHVQVDELVRNPDADERAINLIAMFRVRPRLVETSLFVLDVSRLDLARLSDDEGAAAFERHLGVGAGRSKHAEDATTVGTAAALNATFVTQDKGDRSRMTRGHPDLRVIEYREFLTEIEKLPLG